MNLRYPNPKETLWPAILEAIANGQSLSSILRQEGMPSYAWAKAQLRGDPEIRRMYDQAIEDRGDRLAEELIELAFRPLPEGLDGREQSALVQLRRLQVDTLKWASSKLRPRVYGERLDVSFTNTQISITGALEMAEKRVLDILQKEVNTGREDSI
jgi:hypothetical protein